MEMKDWVRLAREAADLTQEQFGERLGVTKGNVSAWENGRHSPSYHQVLAMSRLGGIATPGEGGSNDIAFAEVRSRDAVPEGYVRLRLLDATPYMGAGGEPVDFPEVMRYVDVLRAYLVTELGCNPDNIDLLPTNGDSMKGTIEHGDIAFVDRTVRHFDGDGVYVLVWGNGLMIKRLQALPWGGMKIKSDNPKYETVDVVGDDVNRITICGRVTGSWKVRRI